MDHQYPLFSAKESEIEREIQKMDIDNINLPIEALNKIMNGRKRYSPIRIYNIPFRIHSL